MLNQPVQYTDYDGVNRTATLRFNLTRLEVVENLELRLKLQEVEPIVAGESRDLSQEDIIKVLGMVKLLAKAAYGVKVDDRFIKNEEVWDELTQRAVYDEFLFQIFDGTINANAFISGLLPRVLREEMAKQTANESHEAPIAPNDGTARPEVVQKYVGGLNSHIGEVVDETQRATWLGEDGTTTPVRLNEDGTTTPVDDRPEWLPTDERPQWLIDGREPTQAELRVATKEQMFEAFRLRSNS